MMTNTATRTRIRKKQPVRPDEAAFRAIGYPLLILFALFCMLPFLLVICSSFDSEHAIANYGFSLIPREPTLDSYILTPLFNL